ATLNTDRFSHPALNAINGKQAKWTISLLRLNYKEAGSESFVARKFFLKDFLESRVFGVFPVFSQKIKRVGETTDEEKYDHARMTRFNLLLTEDEKKAPRPEKPFKTLKWYFSSNSIKDPDYRAVARRAVDIYDRAFNHISNGKIGVELIEEEEKELGDLRYSLINLVEKDANVESGLLGWGPSYANPNTGEIIGASANIFITKETQRWYDFVQRYVRYELFEKDQKTSADNEFHAITPYTRAVIEDQCGKGEIEEGNVVKFVKVNKQKVTDNILKRSDKLQNRKSILACAKKMLLHRSLLSLILHEMGHNFGLTHNFKASADKENYYQTPEEIKKIFGDDFEFTEETLAKSSSVMDYISAQMHPGMEYLGKYDLGALRYLYLDELEGKKGESISLDINPDLEKQSPLTAEQLEKSKDYFHCSDQFKMKEVFCMPFDYGATPKDIIDNTKDIAEKFLNFGRYRYDKFKYAPTNFSMMIKIPLTVHLLYYNKWEKLRDSHLKNRGFDPVYKLKDPASIDRYNTIVEEGNIPGTEYALYYPIREQSFKHLMEIMDYEEMTCHVSENATGKRHQLALEDIKAFFEHEEDREVENCASFNDVFKTEGLNLEYQTGFEDFTSYYPYHSNNKINKASVSPISNIFISSAGGLVNYPKVIDPSFMSWASEPDLLKELRLKAEQSINWEKNRTNVGTLQSEILLSSYQSSLEDIVSSETEEEQEIKRQLMNYSFGFRNYFLETGHDSSFDNLVEQPLSSGKTVDNPFLVEAYKEYTDHDAPKEYAGSFQQYLRTHKKNQIIITHKKYSKKEVLITPYQKDSFSYRMIQEYNDRVSGECENECSEMNLKAVNNRIESKEGPSLIDRVNKIALERYTTKLLERIKEEAR
ncbi:MAG: zinc-dependent metalloprotease, partial [Oligoflexia bacterium]|nr:zinc-dependent metalloprotease [Oligoflexia bacterium]